MFLKRNNSHLLRNQTVSKQWVYPNSLMMELLSLGLFTLREEISPVISYAISVVSAVR